MMTTGERAFHQAIYRALCLMVAAYKEYLAASK